MQNPTTVSIVEEKALPVRYWKFDTLSPMALAAIAVLPSVEISD
jgi:hypothetical protein